MTAERISQARRDLIRLADERQNNRFRSDKARNKIWEQYEILLHKWDRYLIVTFGELLQKQRREVVDLVSKYGVNAEPIALAFINENQRHWNKELTPLYLSLMTDFAYQQMDVLNDAEEKGKSFETKAKRKSRNKVIDEGFYSGRTDGTIYPISQMTRNSQAITYVANRLDNYLPDMATTTKKQINIGIRKGYDSAIALGLTGTDFTEHVADELRTRLGKKNLHRADMLARTEALALSNKGKDTAIKSSGLITTKEWITMRDDAVRDAHRAMDGKEVTDSKDFQVSGYRMYLPGDSTQGAPLNLVINCRCTVTYHEKYGRRRR